MTARSLSVCHFLRLVLLVSFAIGSSSTFLSHNSFQQQHQQQAIVEHPNDQYVKIGDQALFKCKIRNLRGEPQWCIDDFCLGLTKTKSNQASDDEDANSLKGRPRYKIVGDKAKGEFHLLVEPVQLQDNMYFYCMATAASETIKAVKSRKVFLTVLTYPQTLNLENPVHVSLNKPSSVQCVARQSRPPVKILMAINGELINDDSKYSTDIVRFAAQKEFNSDATMKRSSSHVNSLYELSSDELRESYYDTITNVTIDDVTMRMHGQSIECFAYSFLNVKGPSFNLNNRFNSANVKKNFNMNSFQSNVMNTKSIIQVDYAPEVNLKVVSANRALLYEDDVINLDCEAKATPAIHSYKWFIGNTLLSGVSNSLLNLKLRKEMHMQTITCEAANTVASVKASIQLDIQYKPAFKKGPRSYMMVDQNACNKPLTLDCQVSSNPASNITWFRRRLSRGYLKRLHQSLNVNKNPNGNQNEYRSAYGSGRALYKLYSLLGYANQADSEAMYEDDFIGTGPTYIIASFSCGNKLQLPNRNRSVELQLQRRAARSQEKKRQAQESSVNQENQYQTSSTDYEYDEEELHNEMRNDRYDAQVDELQNTDFGLYICEAANNFAEQNVVERRYIKINPIGAASTRAISASTNALSSEQIATFMMKSVIKQRHAIEIAAKLGDSVTLACLVEPLPQYESIYWIRDNGKIIPNSKFSIYSHADELSGERVKMIKNIKVKYENLTTTNSKNEPSYLNEHESNEVHVALSNNIDSNGIEWSNRDVLRTTLHIRKVSKKDLGVYKCKSVNAYGSNVAHIVLREQTFLDKLNMNAHVSPLIFMLLMICTFALFTFLFALMYVKCCSSSCCCCCCPNRRRRELIKERKLLADNLHCDLNSDKTINEWLASSKLSNDNNSNNNNTSTTTAATILQNGLVETINLTSANSSASKSKSTSNSHSPNQVNTQEISLNDDPNESDLDNNHVSMRERCNLIIYNDSDNHNFVEKKDKYQQHTLNKLLPLISRRDGDKESSGSGGEREAMMSNTLKRGKPEYKIIHNLSTASSSSSSSSTNTMGKTTLKAVRTNNFTNGNFNAKISSPSAKTIVCTPLLSTEDSSQAESENNYERIRTDDTSLSKFLQQESAYKMSDLFNELSPSLLVSNPRTNNNNNSFKLSDPITNSTHLFSQLNSSFIASNHQQQQPQTSTNVTYSQPLLPQHNHSNHHNQNTNATNCGTLGPRQILFSNQINNPTASQHCSSTTTNGISTTHTLCKFPNPFANSPHSTPTQTASAANNQKMSSSTNNFYNNFYRHQPQFNKQQTPLKINNNNNSSIGGATVNFNNQDKCKHLNV